MFAIVGTGGKQYKVKAGDKLNVEKIEGEIGKKISFDNVLLSGSDKSAEIGKGKVEAEIIDQGKGDKVIIFKKKRRQNYRRKNGHRQFQTTLFVTSVSNGKDTEKAEVKGKAKVETSIETKTAPKAKKAEPTTKASKATDKKEVAKKPTSSAKPDAKAKAEKKETKATKKDS